MLNAITAVRGNYEFVWDVGGNAASCKNLEKNAVIWRGSLLPSFYISRASGDVSFEEGRAVEAVSITPDRWTIAFAVGDAGEGSFSIELLECGLRLYDLRVKWNQDTNIIGMYFGAKKMDEYKSNIVPLEGQVFWPDWRVEGFCVPCTGSSPSRSFWRKWDWGNASIALGSYGPAMGTPYSAAFPRPLYACAMGGKGGWMAAGPGEVPDGALTLRIKSASACLEYLYREDLWGAPNGRERVWKEPLRMAWGSLAYTAYEALFRYLAPSGTKPAAHCKSLCTTWGSFAVGDFDLMGLTDRYCSQLPGDVMMIDDYWETSLGSGIADKGRFPTFEQDIAYIRQKGMDIGLWQAIGWIHSPESAGLGHEDLLCGEDGKPRLAQWLMDPFESEARLCYCMDPSSPKTRRYLQERTRRCVKTHDPAVLKLDFGYGLPGPDVCAPKDPAFRGEQLCLALLEIIGNAARAVKPDITILYYGISPLLFHAFDLLSLDDMGDCGSSAEYEIAGHSQRCVWASLVSSTGMPCNTSSGYYWKSLDEILLDTAVLGANGTVLPRTDAAGGAISPAQACRWRAIQTWRRKTSLWHPLWLDAELGRNGAEPAIRSWARVEQCEGKPGISAASLRAGGNELRCFAELPGITFTGNWALLSQDGKDIFSSRELAIVPFSQGMIQICREFNSVKRVTLGPENIERTEDLPIQADRKLTLSTTGDQLNELIGYLVCR